MQCKFLYIHSHTQVSHTFTSLVCSVENIFRAGLGTVEGCVWMGGGFAGACSVIVVGRLLRILAVDCKWALCLPCPAQILASNRGEAAAAAGTGGGAAGQLVVLLLVWQKFFDDVAKVFPLLSSNPSHHPYTQTPAMPL